MTFPSWMSGCPGCKGGFGVYESSIPSLTGLHQFDRVGRKKADVGKTECRVCGGQPPVRFRDEAWQRVLAAENAAREERDRRALLKAER